MIVLLRTLLLVGVLWTLAAPAYAEAPALTVRAGVHEDYDRIVVDWPRQVAYTVHRDGAHVTVDFAAPGEASWQNVIIARLTRASGFLSSADKDGNLTISFTVNPKATIKDFISGNSVVIDVTGAAVGSAAPETTAAPPPKPAPAAAVEKVPEKPPKKTAEKAPEEKPVPPPAAVPASTPPKPETPAPAPADVTPTPAPPAVAAAPAKPVSFPAFGADPLLVASLDPHTPSRAAIYQRGGYAYIVFDRKLTISLDALTAGLPAPLIPLEALDLPKASGYRLPLPPNAEIRAARNDTAWQIFILRRQPEVPVSSTLVAQPDFALGARMLLPLPDAPEPVHITDPVVGDDLILVPLSEAQAFSVGRTLADFEILPAAQGLVILPLIDKLIVRAVSDGIEITAEGGLHLSTASDTGSSQESSQKAKAAASGKSMFDFATWRGKPGETFTETRQRLQQTIVDVPEAERNRARLELARFYFAHGNGEESEALLTYLTKLVPDIAAHADFLALDGAAKILAWRPDEGLKDFDTPTLVNQPEIDLWKAVAEAELRDWAGAEQKFSTTETMLVGYPEPFYSRFSVLAVESALAVGRDHEAADWLDRLENGPHSDSVDVSLEYLHGILEAKAGHAEKAEQAWKDVAASNDNLYRVRAKLALIDLGVSTKSLTPAQAADQLESLRFAWRGDDLELDILHRLGEFYVEAHNVKAGLNTLAKAVQLYPNSPMTPAIHTEMEKNFRDVFLTDTGSALSPLDALTLYQQYRDLMPPGADGIAVTRNLVERLVQIDLLDQASDLLEDLVKNKLQGEDKGRASTRLAAVRLLNHDPERALQALDMANSQAYPADLQDERTLLRARALSEMKKYDDALALIKDNTAQPAKLLRTDILMHAQRWGDASEALLNLIGPPPAPGVALTPEQAGWLINCAIAVSLAGDSAGLEKLRNDYSAPVASLPQNDTFLMLTQPERSDESRDIAAAQSKISEVDLFQGFLDTYRKNGAVSSVDTEPVLPPATAPAPAPAPAKP